MDTGNKKLEEFVDAALRELPQRPAPSTLESRVLAAVAHRAALPWWRRGFDQWPLFARIAFLISAAAVAKLALSAAGWIVDMIESAPIATSGVREVTVVGASVIEAFHGLAATVPMLWIYGGMVMVATLYAALFGLAAVAYRSLVVSR